MFDLGRSFLASVDGKILRRLLVAGEYRTE